MISFQNSFRVLQQRKHIRELEQKERDALLSRKFTTNDQEETSIFLDHELQHHDKLKVSGYRSTDERMYCVFVFIYVERYEKIRTFCTVCLFEYFRFFRYVNIISPLFYSSLDFFRHSFTSTQLPRN